MYTYVEREDNKRNSELMAYCGKCGKYVPDGVFKCPHCGAISRRGAKKKLHFSFETDRLVTGNIGDVCSCFMVYHIVPIGFFMMVLKVYN